MAQRDAAAVHLTDDQAPRFAAGDRVLIKRNLNHPAWMKCVKADPRDGGRKWVRDPNVTEAVGETTVEDVQKRLSGTEVYANGFWYDARSGMQTGCGATFITKVQLEG